MNTVSFILTGNGQILTSNTDELINLDIARFPEFPMVNGIKPALPKKREAGGTWLIANETPPYILQSLLSVIRQMKNKLLHKKKLIT